MAAPKNPNVTAAAATRRAMGDLTASNRLFESGWLTLSPAELDRLPENLRVRLRAALAELDIREPWGLNP